MVYPFFFYFTGGFLFHYCQVAEIQFKTHLADSISLKLNDASFYLKQQYYTPSRSERDKTWLEALRNLRNICAHHNILVGRTSSVVLPEPPDSQTLISNTDLFSRLYALKKILPVDKHAELKHNLQVLIKKSKINIFKLEILPSDWETRFDSITLL